MTEANEGKSLGRIAFEAYWKQEAKELSALPDGDKFTSPKWTGEGYELDHAKWESSAKSVATFATEQLRKENEELRAGYTVCVDLIKTYQMCKGDVDIDWDELPKRTLCMAHEEITRLQSLLEEVQKALVDHNNLLRTAYNVAEREAEYDEGDGSTNWRPFRDRLKEELTRHHQITNAAREAVCKLPTPKQA